MLRCPGEYVRCKIQEERHTLSHALSLEAVRVLVVYCHPNETSFASALHQTVLKALRTRGHEVTDLDLYADGFRPVMSRDERQEYEDPAQYRETVMKYALQLAEAEAIVAVNPTWWYGLPAMLKGYFDRVWAPGIAFDRCRWGLPNRQTG